MDEAIAMNQAQAEQTSTTVRELATPCLVLDAERMDRNIARLKAIVDRLGAPLASGSLTIAEQRWFEYVQTPLAEAGGSGRWRGALDLIVHALALGAHHVDHGLCHGFGRTPANRGGLQLLERDLLTAPQSAHRPNDNAVTRCGIEFLAFEGAGNKLLLP